MAEAPRVVARLDLPMEMGTFARICKEIARAFPAAVLSEPDQEGEVVISSGPTPKVSPSALSGTDG